MSQTYTLQIQNNYPFDLNQLQLHTKVWVLHRKRITPMKICAIQLTPHGLFYSLQSVQTNANPHIESLNNVGLSAFHTMVFLSEEKAIQALKTLLD